MNLKELRNNEKLTLKQVCEITNCKVSTLSQYENGKRKPTIDNAFELAKLYKVSVDEILKHFKKGGN